MPQPTPGPWEASGHKKPSSPKQWAYVQHHFPEAPYEGDFDDEWGVYPPFGESGPVAIVAGEANARLIAHAPAMREALQAFLDSAGKVPILQEAPYTLPQVVDALPFMEAMEGARALLRQIEEG